LAALLGLSATATAAQADASAPRSPHGGPVKQLAQAYAGTAKFHSVSAALQAGYVPTGPCVEVPGQGGLGIVYGNFGLLADGKVDPRTPEALFYEPRANGKLRLVGVEYILLDADGDPATVEDPPRSSASPSTAPPPSPKRACHCTTTSRCGCGSTTPPACSPHSTRMCTAPRHDLR
jgi:hypothetical protein